MRRSYQVLQRVSRLPLASAVVALSVAGGSVAARAGDAMPFLAHQAMYDLSLLKSSGGGAAVDSARGRMLYNFSGSVCEGYTSEFRQVSELNGSEGRIALSDLRSTTWEDAEGKSFRFKIDSRMNEGDATVTDGIAERTGDHITVKLKEPVAKTFTIDGATVFPTEQVRRIIAAAREGKSLLELSIYDGSDTGEKVYNTLTVIGRPIPGDQITRSPDSATASDALKTVTRWPVTVSYYDRNAENKNGEQTPVYAMSFELYENGVSRALTLDYGNFALAGAMGKFEVKETPPCKETPNKAAPK